MNLSNNAQTKLPEQMKHRHDRGKKINFKKQSAR